eukprot:Sdes_comp23157_c0_seq1m21460
MKFPRRNQTLWVYLERLKREKSLENIILGNEESCFQYGCDLSKFSDESFSKRFVQLNMDEETREFLKNCNEKTFLRLSFENLFLTLSTLFISKTSANGILHRGKMFVLSTEQLNFVLCDWIKSFQQAKSSPENGSLVEQPPIYFLDIGAGDGEITAKFEKTICETILEGKYDPKNFPIKDMIFTTETNP